MNHEKMHAWDMHFLQFYALCEHKQFGFYSRCMKKKKKSFAEGYKGT